MRPGLIGRLRERGVIRVAASYAVIAWLVLQIGDVTLGPLGAPPWVMRALVILAVVGFPIAVALAWYFELSPSGIELDDAPSSQPRPAVRGIRRYLDVAVIGVLALTVAFLLLRQSHVIDTEATRLPEASLAVLPFANASGNAADEYFAVGLSDELRDQLTRVPALRIISRLSSQAARESALDIPQLAAQLGVAAIVDGSIRRSRDRLRASVELIDGRNGRVIWSQSYDRSTADTLSVQSDIATQIVHAVLPQFVAQGGELPAPSASNVSAQDLYLLARQTERGNTPEAFAKARVLYEQAIGLDPRYAAAHAALGRTIAWENGELADTDPAALDRLVLPHLDRALELDRSNSEAYLVKGVLRRLELRPGGDEYFRMAAELDPNSRPAQEALAEYALAQNRPDLYLEHSLRGRELDPLWPWTHVYVVYSLMTLGRTGDLPAAVSRMMDLFSSKPYPAAVACKTRSLAGRPDETLACALQTLRRFPDSLAVIQTVAEACFYLGDLDCGKGALARAARLGDEEASLWLAVENDDQAAIESAIRDFDADPRRDHQRARLVISTALATGLDDEAQRLFRAAHLDRATTEDAVLRRDDMVLQLQMVELERGSSTPLETGRRIDDLLEWTARPLQHGGKEYSVHVERAFALALARRNDEAIAEIEAATRAPDSPFDVRVITNCPVGRVLGRDPRLGPLLQKVRDRQAALRSRLPQTLKAAGVDPDELAVFQKANPKPT